MERICAALAMEWSIELDKSLRSKHRPGKAIEAIRKMGPRLIQWSGEPEPTLAVCNMFGLVAGEGRLFANAILVHLVDALRFGGRDIRVSLVKIFLSELRSREKMNRWKPYKGILSKARVHNPSELIKRVRFVYDTGDTESRALALVLFGCWADFVIDSAHVRYLVLSSMVSSEVLEVKASLFAAGCFCGLASDFSAVVLEMLVNLVSSDDILHTVRLAGACLFAKLGYSYSVAIKAYKAGLKLVVASSDEDLAAALLYALSKLALGWNVLQSEQVHFLLSFLDKEKSAQLQSTSIRCLHFVIARVNPCPVGEKAVRILLGVVEETYLPSTLQYQALHILHKLLLYGEPSLTHQKAPEFGYLLEILQRSLASTLAVKNLLAIRVLIDALTKLKRYPEMANWEGCSSPLLCTMPIVVDGITLLLSKLLNLGPTFSGTIREVHDLLNLLLLLVKEYPDQATSVLDKLISCIQGYVDRNDAALDAGDSGVLNGRIEDSREDKESYVDVKLTYVMHKLLVLGFEVSDDLGEIKSQVLEKVVLLADCVTRCSSFGSHRKVLYSMLSHGQIMWDLVHNQMDAVSSHEKSYYETLGIRLAELEVVTLECVKRTLNEKDNWHAYKGGKLAALQGAWMTATFIFEQLTTEVQSDSCSSWLKALSLFSQSEKKMHLFRLSSSKDWLLTKGSDETTRLDDLMVIDQSAVGNIDELIHVEMLAEACYDLWCSGKTLQAVPALGKLFCFQSWFLGLKAKLLDIVVHVLKILGRIFLEQDNTMQFIDCLRHVSRQALELKGLAEEADLMAKSFVEMDSESMQIISIIALRCSLLAFIAAFALFIPELLNSKVVETSGVDWSNLQSEVGRDLIGRLWLSDEKTSCNIRHLLDVHGKSKHDFNLKPRNQTHQIGGQLGAVLSLCDDAVSGVVGLRDAAKSINNAETPLQATKDGLQLLYRTVAKWSQIPFYLPVYFFKMRPCVGSKLFVLNADETKQNELSVTPGSHLSLNVCLQLKNFPPSDHSFRPEKFYCILSTSSVQEPPPFWEATEQAPLDYRSWDTANMVAMNKKLLHFVAEGTVDDDNGQRGTREDDDDYVVSEFVSLQMYTKSQGFSSCLLDVSNFPVGSYVIKWHSCCIDQNGTYWSLLPLNSGPVFTVGG